MCIKRFITIVLLFCGTLAAAPLTLSELIHIALENNPSTRQSWWNAQRAAAALGCAKSSYYPQVDLDANVQNGRTFQFVNGPDTDYTIVGADLIVTLLLYDYGARSASVEAAKNALMAANWQTDWMMQKVMVRVFEHAYALAHAKEELQAAIVSQEDAQQLLYVATELNRTGISPISDVYTTQATLSQMKMVTSMQKANVAIQTGKLAASLGLCADAPLELVAFEPPPVQHQGQVAALIHLAQQKRADLLAKRALVGESLAKQDKARAGYGPKVSLSGDGGVNHAFQDNTGALQYNVMLDVRMPLFNGFETVYQNRLAYADTQVSVEEMNELQLNIALDVLTYSKTVEAAQEMLPDADDNLKNATKAYEGTLERYRAGKENIAEVSNALRQLAAARVRYSDVKTRWLVSLANLAYATGTLGVPCKSS